MGVPIEALKIAYLKHAGAVSQDRRSEHRRSYECPPASLRREIGHCSDTSPSRPATTQSPCRSLPKDITIVLIEHDMDLLLSLVGWVTCLNNGQFLAEGTPADIRTNAGVQSVYLGKPHRHA